MTDTFYMVYPRKYPDNTIPFIEENDVPILTNAKDRWSDHQDDFLPIWRYDTERVIDAGGFGILADRGGYPWSVEQYHDWLNENADQFEWATCMDFACEQELSDIGTVEQRVDWTIENTIEQWEMDRDYKLLPVIQGHTVDQYVDCYERMLEAGIDMSHVGLGSVCRRSSSDELVEVVDEIRERCDEIEKVHGFGTKLNTLHMGVDLDTMDSAAWTECPMNGKTLRPIFENTDVDRDEGCEWGEPEGEMIGAVQDDRGDDSARKSMCMSFETYYAQASKLVYGEPAVDPHEIWDRWERS